MVRSGRKEFLPAAGYLHTVWEQILQGKTSLHLIIQGLPMKLIIIVLFTLQEPDMLLTC